MESEIISTQKLVQTISELLTNICDNNTQELNKDSLPKEAQVFYSKKIPSISIPNYIERIQKYTQMSDSSLIIMLIYLDQISEVESINIDYFNIHKLILASAILAIKYEEDQIYLNKYYASVGGISLKEMNKLEYNFLTLLDFNLYVSDEIFQQYKESLSNYNNNQEEENSSDIEFDLETVDSNVDKIENENMSIKLHENISGRILPMYNAVHKEN